MPNILITADCRVIILKVLRPLYVSHCSTCSACPWLRCNVDSENAGRPYERVVVGCFPKAFGTAHHGQHLPNHSRLDKVHCDKHMTETGNKKIL